MNELIPVILAIIGVISIACSFALINLGKMIDEFPQGDETSQTRGLTSPVESTKIAVLLFWVMFLPGAWAVLQEGIVIVIVGITLLFAICLFMLTALVFSFAVLNTMGVRKNENDEAVMGVSTPPHAENVSTSGEPAVNPPPRKNPLLNVIVHTLLKK